MGELKQRCRRRACQAESSCQVDGTTRNGQPGARGKSHVILPFLADIQFKYWTRFSPLGENHCSFQAVCIVHTSDAGPRFRTTLLTNAMWVKRLILNRALTECCSLPYDITGSCNMFLCDTFVIGTHLTLNSANISAREVIMYELLHWLPTFKLTGYCSCLLMSRKSILKLCSAL